MFQPNRKDEHTLDFIRYDYWLHKLLKFDVQLMSNFSLWSYKKAFKNAKLQ